MVRRSRFTLAAVSSGYVLRFSSAALGPADANQRVLPLVRFILLQGIALASFAPLLQRAPLVGLRYLFSAIRTDRLHIQSFHTLVALPTSTVSHRLRGHPSSPSVPGLFHPGSTPEVHHTGGSPRTAAETLVVPRFPSCRYHAGQRDFPWACLGHPREIWIGFRGLLSVRIRSPAVLR